ncbi:MAG: NAD(P)/FAD-dependent oxidoreductase [Alphaproteobacteria bacterium]|nr:NAD(P)/FAD-dependent oxidoreductase [Alphaproteobacteria bacterium]
MEQFDAVIIGSGHNGLAAAIHLRKRGWSVVVLEAAASAGGAVKTCEVTSPGFRHDLCAMNLSMFAGSPFFAQYKDELTAHGLKLVGATDCFATVYRDHSHLGVSTDLESTVAAIGSVSERDAVAWRAMVERFGADAPHIFALLGAPMPSFAAARAVLTALRRRGLNWLSDTARLLLSSPRDFLDAHFESAKLKTLMAAWGLHLDFTPDTAGGALFPYLESMANQSFGMVIGEGGADTIIRAMCSLLSSGGVEVRLNAKVAAIETECGRASGVQLADGRRIAAKRAVIANLHPQLVFGRLLPETATPALFNRRVAGIRPGPGTMMIHLALNRPLDWRGGEALRSFAYVHLAPDLAMMSRVYAEAAGGLLPVEPVLVVGQPSAIDPGRAPAGQQALWVQVRVLPAEIKGDAAGQIAASHWDEAKQPYSERVLDLLEHYAPGLRARILGRAVFSPLDLERENPSLIGGDNLAGSHRLDQNFLFRPVVGWSRYRTPVGRLYLCGAATWPGAGTGAGSGYMLGRMLAG